MILVDDPTSKDEFVPFLNQNKDIIITGPHLCFKDARKKAKEFFVTNYPHYKLEWIFFENDPIKCMNNINHRNDGREVIQFIKYCSKHYNPPITKRNIWQP